MIGVRLYLAQRISALLMAPLVLIHLGVIIYASQGGLDAAEILARTEGSVVWGTFYSLFVLAVSVHAAIGLRAVVFEWFRLKGKALEIFTWAVGFGLLLLGGRAVFAVVA